MSMGSYGYFNAHVLQCIYKYIRIPIGWFNNVERERKTISIIFFISYILGSMTRLLPSIP